MSSTTNTNSYCDTNGYTNPITRTTNSYTNEHTNSYCDSNTYSYSVPNNFS
jgi:hypothetical protein